MLNTGNNQRSAFLGINIDLIENPKYQELDLRALVLYSLYEDRARLSLYNYTEFGITNFVDKHGVYIVYSNEEARKILRVSDYLVCAFRKQLKNAGLIEVHRNGLKGYKIYVKAVQSTPKNTKRLMPWKNHSIQIKREVSAWTLEAQFTYWRHQYNKSRLEQKQESKNFQTTCPENLGTSVSHFSLNNIYNNDLIDNASARVNKSSLNQTTQKQESKNPKYTAYHALPGIIKKSFNRVFGFINNSTAKELHSLIRQSNVDMVNYAIEHSEGRKIVNPIAYVKQAIKNALSRGEKCVQDMKSYYENNIKGLKYPRRYMTEEMANEQVKRELEELRENDLELWQRIKDQVAATKKRKANRPLIPIYHLGE